MPESSTTDGGFARLEGHSIYKEENVGNSITLWSDLLFGNREE